MGQKRGTAFKNGSKKCPFKYLEQFLNIWGQAKIWTYSLTSYWDRKLKYLDKRAEAALASRRVEAVFAKAVVWDNTGKKMKFNHRGLTRKKYFCPFLLLAMFVYLCFLVALEIFQLKFSLLK